MALGNRTEADFAALVRYYLYGSTSAAQARGCHEHDGLTRHLLGSKRARKHPTNAVLYAVGELDECRADAGPACVPHYTDEEVVEDWTSIDVP